VSDPGEPALEGLGLGGRDGLDDAENCLGIGAVCKPLFSVGSKHFQLSDFFGHFSVAFLKQFLFQVAPVLTRAITASKNLDNINDREPPLAIVDGFPDLPAFKDGKFRDFFSGHLMTPICSQCLHPPPCPSHKGRGA